MLLWSSSGSHSVRDRSRMRPVGHLRRSFCILGSSDDRRIHGCGPEIPADSSARVKTPASALMHGACWTCRGSSAASRFVPVFAVSFRTPTFRTGSSGLHMLDSDLVGAREPALEQCSGGGLVGGAPRGGPSTLRAAVRPRKGLPPPAVFCVRGSGTSPRPPQRCLGPAGVFLRGRCSLIPLRDLKETR